MIKTEKNEVIIESLRLKQTKLMLKSLSRDLTDKTEIIEVPYGTKSWRIVREVATFDGNYKERFITIDLQLFFGLWVGYETGFDILVFWKP